MRNFLDRYLSLFKRWDFLTGQTNFVKGASPRGGWPIQPYSRSKYSPHNEITGCKSAQRRLRQLGKL